MIRSLVISICVEELKEDTNGADAFALQVGADRLNEFQFNDEN